MQPKRRPLFGASSGNLLGSQNPGRFSEKRVKFWSRKIGSLKARGECGMQSWEVLRTLKDKNRNRFPPTKPTSNLPKTAFPWKKITSLRAIPTLHSRAYDLYDKFLHILGTSTPNSNQPLPTDNLPRKNGKALLQAHFKLIGEQQLLARGRSRRQGTRVMHLQKPPPAPRSAEHTRGHQQQNQTGELLWRDTGGIHWRILASRSGSILAGYSAGSTDKGYSAGCSAGSAGELLWDTQRDTCQIPLAGCCGGILGGIHWLA